MEAKTKDAASYNNTLIKKVSVRVLALLFINCTVWLGGSIVFMYLERPTEAVHKCGVRRVRRDFLDNLWTEASTMDESDWKSLARNKLETFEQELHTAVEAGLNSYSSQNVWTPSNAILYTFTLSTTIGYGSLTPSSPWVRLLSILFAGLACPLFALLLADVSQLVQLFAQKACINLSTVTQTLAALMAHCSFGSLLFAFLFNWSLEDCMYFIGSTVTTIGFGDIVPEDNFLFLCLGLYFITGLALYSLYQDAAMTWLSQVINKWFIRSSASKQHLD